MSWTIKTQFGLPKTTHKTQEPSERVPSGQSWNNLSKYIHKVVLDYNPKHKINIHESTLM